MKIDVDFDTIETLMVEAIHGENVECSHSEVLHIVTSVLASCSMEQRAAIWGRLDAVGIHVHEPALAVASQPGPSVLSAVAKDIEEVFRKHGLRPESVQQLVNAVETTDRGDGDGHDN